MSEELKAALARIACLEGEIAKRDETIARLEPQLNRAIQANYDLREELAACRVAVENCDLFRARIAELEARIVWLECEAQVNAAPVSEAKAQGVVMPKPCADCNGLGFGVFGCCGECYGSGHKCATTPVQQVNVPDGPNYKRKFETLVDHCKRQDKEIADLRYDANIRRFYDDSAVWFWVGDETDNLETLACPVVINAGDLRALLAAAPAAPAADAGASLIKWTKDAVEWGDALNYSAWEFVNECPEKSALLFNNTKGPLRAAIMKYAEIVAATAKDSSHD